MSGQDTYNRTWADYGAAFVAAFLSLFHIMLCNYQIIAEEILMIDMK